MDLLPIRLRDNKLCMILCTQSPTFRPPLSSGGKSTLGDRCFLVEILSLCLLLSLSTIMHTAANSLTNSVS